MTEHTRDPRPRRKVLLLASGGGHWVQLLRLADAWAGHEAVYATVQPAYRDELPPGTRFHVFQDATRWDRWKLLKMVLQVIWIVLRERPDVVLSTGAAPGVVALRVGKWLGARTVWIDSIANVEALSMSGGKAGAFVDLWLTQWPHLAGTASADAARTPEYHGAVL
jgi:UDP-N-acetylglucosamine:LPS N-acetylglucosamine transferase